MIVVEGEENVAVVHVSVSTQASAVPHPAGHAAAPISGERVSLVSKRVMHWVHTRQSEVGEKDEESAVVHLIRCL